ncbi:hypothetical protein CDIK_4556 [Cucumispora dikerogammari]|nr:hypothetical protein CDIK_4556 [Cucumispora dikerogammari]
MIDFYENNRPVNGEDFLGYIINLKNICSTKNIQEPHFILDNAKIHHYKRLKELSGTENIKLLFYPILTYAQHYRKLLFEMEKLCITFLCNRRGAFIKFDKRRFFTNNTK